ncbi:SAM-dependent methyltransferase [Ichthyenterobacterium sp. W332]|uniref:SAM-dependent methyltransferase n=1 Tax=Microcosmobacter mediterraneus TaxID=3075607 RepID=A0ABU2YI13_9FLAO|nr:SAM-dependent methyltransferase [Ichthyenterobacterium sp. W332]MDT0557516.1 SAM-dependent methyltransferase [Ichthyenterobacterium sp. W332]
MQDSIGKLYLIPTRLGDNPPLEVLPISIKKIIERIDHYIVENEKTARRFIKRVTPNKSQPSLKIKLLNKYTDSSELYTFLEDCKQGKDVGLLSEAGCPAIADPGSDIVDIAHKEGIRVIPLVGPSSLLLALMASGMNGQGFTFNGYLPIDNTERKRKIKQLEKQSFDLQHAQIFIETPYRNNKMLDELSKHLHPSTRVCVACDLTLPTEYINTQTVSDWQKTKVDLHKRPTIFIIQKD